MKTLNLATISADFADALDKVDEQGGPEYEPLLITVEGREEPYILMSHEAHDSLEETIHIMSNPEKYPELKADLEKTQ